MFLFFVSGYQASKVSSLPLTAAAILAVSVGLQDKVEVMITRSDLVIVQ